MASTPQEMNALADHMGRERSEIVSSWQRAIQRDPKLTGGDSLPCAELLDHIPALLAVFERSLRQAVEEEVTDAQAAGQETAALHGLQRWKQGYDLREVTRELGKLNECVVLKINEYSRYHSEFSLEALSRAQQLWAALASASIEESVSQYFSLQQQEAAGHVKDLESALDQVRQLEQQRGEIWQQAAHDLRGNLSVVANATFGLTQPGRSDSSREDFVRILRRNITSLHHLLNDVTSLARLQAGREKRAIEPIDMTAALRSLCEGIRPLAGQRGLFLHCEGPPKFLIEADAVKVGRIAQNLILNAVKYTRKGGITVTWGDSGVHDSKRWALGVADTGPGFHTESGKPLAAALDEPHAETVQSSTGLNQKEEGYVLGHLPLGKYAPDPLRGEPGEGIGLSIVKRLCEMLDATIEMQSVPGAGTSFRILFPRRYTNTP